MEYKQLSPNPLAKDKNLQLFPFLEPNPNTPIVIPKLEPVVFQNHPNMYKHHYKKKPKYTNPNQPSNVYQIPPRKLPVYRNPTPQASPSLDPNRYVHSGQNRSSIVYPAPTLVKLTNTGKLNRMLRNSQPGMMVFLRHKEDIHCILMAAKWENHIIYRGPNYYTHLIAEFYGNLEIKQREGVFYFSSFVGGKNVYVDHYVLNRSLRLGNKTSELPCINIYEKFVFNKNEFELFLGLFCEEDVPKGLCTENCGISFIHFTSKYQKLAMILRANILPKPKNDQFFDFIDLKVMFQLVTNTVEFNLNYLLVLNMIYAHIVDFMPYGLMLTSVFETYYVQMPRVYASKIELCCVENLTQPRLSLCKCQPLPLTQISFPSFLLKTDNLDLINSEISKLNKEVSKLQEFNGKLLMRLGQIERKIEKSGGKLIGEIDAETSRRYEVQLENEIVVGVVDGDVSLPEVAEVLASMCENG